MKILSIIAASLLVVFTACESGNSIQKLDAASFSKQIAAPNANVALVDVRTPEEYNRGHIANAKNIDWNGENFATEIKALDMSQPVYVYCLSGGRSGEAAAFMRKNGFKQVYELDGGVRAWSTAKMPLTEEEQIAADTTKTVAAKAQLGTAGFAKLAGENQLTMFDFSATWCGPCKALAPRLEEVEKEMAGKFRVVKIDVDQERQLADSMNVTSIPLLLLYKNGKVLWRSVGLVEKSEIEDALNSAMKP